MINNLQGNTTQPQIGNCNKGVYMMKNNELAVKEVVVD